MLFSCQALVGPYLFTSHDNSIRLPLSDTLGFIFCCLERSNLSGCLCFPCFQARSAVVHVQTLVKLASDALQNRTLSSIVRASVTFTAAEGTRLCSSWMPYMVVSNSATHSPPLWSGSLGQPTLTHRRSIVVGSGASLFSRARMHSSSSCATPKTKTYRLLLSNHLAPRSKSCWQNSSSSSWSWLRWRGGWTG